MFSDSQVERDEAPKDWRFLGGIEVGERTTANYVYKSVAKLGDVRFETAPIFACDELSEREIAECCNCEYNEAKDGTTVSINWHDNVIEDIKWKGTKYEVGDFVFVDPEDSDDPWTDKRKKPPTTAELFKTEGAKNKPELRRKQDNRKPKGYVSSSIVPLRVARIVGIRVTKKTAAQKALPNQVKVTLRYFERIDEDVDNEYEAKTNPNGLRWNEDRDDELEVRFFIC